MTKVKICGITNLEDAKVSIDAGCDALGFVFYKKSPRYIAPEKAKDIIKNLPDGILKIGVFVNAKEETIKKIAKSCGLDILQFHGNESTGFCRRFKKYRIIKAVRVKDRINSEQILKYEPFAYLFDAFVEKKAGGTGKNFDWRLMWHLRSIKKPIFLSGGLNTQNVRRAIETVHPDWVDVSSGVETAPGKKDSKKVADFITRVK